MAATLSNVITKVSADTTNFEQGMKRARKQSEQFGNTSKKVNQQMRFMRGGFGQVGHQIQDVAVQLQMGQNAMLVFGQQGSQIASLFGPGGAVIGAVLAVGAALSMALLPRLVGATQAMKDVESETKTLVDRFDELEGAAKLTALRQAREKQDDLEFGIKKANKEIEKQNRILRQQELSTNKSTKVIQRAKDEIEDQKTIIQLANAQIEILKKKVDGVTDSFEKQEASLEKQIETFGKSAHEIRVYGIEADLAAKKIKDGEAQKLIAQSRTLDSLEKNAERQKQLEAERKKAQKDAAKEANDLLKEQERTAQRFADTIGDGFVKAISGAMSFKDAMKNVAKSVVDDLIKMIVQKQITDRVFGLIMNTIGAGTTQPATTASSLSNNSVSNLTGKPFGSSVEPFRMSSASKPSLSMNGGTVNQTINVTTGVQQTVRAEIQNLMPQIQEATKAAVADSRARGGSYSKALVGR